MSGSFATIGCRIPVRCAHIHRFFTFSSSFWSEIWDFDMHTAVGGWSDNTIATKCLSATNAISCLTGSRLQGRLHAASGFSVEVAGLSPFLAVGDRVSVHSRSGEQHSAEIVGFHGESAYAMTYAPAGGLGQGNTVYASMDRRSSVLRISKGWVGRVVDALGQPVDNKGPLPTGGDDRPLRAAPPPPATRRRLGEGIDLGVCVMNTFTPCRAGQRLGLFAGSGVGKSTLLAMLARYAACDVIVVALLGERGREVREFLEDDLGEAGLSRSVVLVATSDTSPLMRRDVAYSAMTVAEYFRDMGRHVLLLVDSISRFCTALREIGLAAGEPPALRGYPPGVFAELPRLLERAGPGPDGPHGHGQITAIFTVLVEGDDHNEPVADAVRGLLDGHVVLDRGVAERGRYPAVDVLRSLSRTVPYGNDDQETAIIARARQLLAGYADVADLVRLGAYRSGADAASDEAIALAPRVEAAIRQGKDQRIDTKSGFERIRVAIGLE